MNNGNDLSCSGFGGNLWNCCRTLRIRRKQNTINVDYTPDKSPIYVEDADFDFVEKFIRDRCVKAKIC